MTVDKVREETWSLSFGARPRADGSTLFRVWAPLAETVAVKIVGDEEQTVSMERHADDVFEATVHGVGAGADYFYLLDGERERPDPVSRWQPRGVHAASRVYDPEAFVWADDTWRGLPLTEFVIYELHTGTFTPEGTFDAVIPKLPHLKELGVTAVELMPVAEFPGGRNWGYDGTYPYAAQSTYGGPEALKRLVDACHHEGLAVVLDVVYNHLGPEGNYFGEYAPIVNKNYRSPWGDALNFDDADSDGVRRFFIDNALYWLTEFHIDGLRLDAVHAIIDTGARHLLEELTDAFRRQSAALGRQAWTIAESDLNDVRLLKPASVGGYGLDAQWSDDFHHALHALLTRTERGYFMDFGRVDDLAKAIREGFVYDGRRSAYRRRRHGNSSSSLPGEQFVVCIQNHDQIANGYWGDRLSTLVSLEAEKTAAALLMWTPNVPMLFMGQEWGERAPFLYFTSHTDAALAEAVRQGRREEYAAFVKNEGETQSALGGFADPQDEATFEQSKLVWSRLAESPHREMHAFYRDLLAHRRARAPLADCTKERTRVEFDEARQWMTVERVGGAGGAGSRSVLVCNLSETAQEIPVTLEPAGGAWRLALWSGDARYGGGAELIAPATELEGDAHTRVRLSGWNAALYVSE
jgi:maltooligosyltrehalose trehalohydrolase